MGRAAGLGAAGSYGGLSLALVAYGHEPGVPAVGPVPVCWMSPALALPVETGIRAGHLKQE